jgi:hypothetical protein
MFDAYDLIALCGQAEHLRAELRLLRAERDGLLVCLATAPIPRKENGCAWESLDTGKGALSDTEKGAESDHGKTAELFSGTCLQQMRAGSCGACARPQRALGKAPVLMGLYYDTSP